MWGASYKHRKFVGLMTEDLMTRLIKDQDLDWCGCDTMGSLGTMAPDGMMIGLMPESLNRAQIEALMWAEAVGR